MPASPRACRMSLLARGPTSAGGAAGRGPALLGHWYLRFSADPDPVSSGLLASTAPPARPSAARSGSSSRPAACSAGTAEDVDPTGRLLVRPADAASATAVSAGDVVHLR